MQSYSVVKEATEKGIFKALWYATLYFLSSSVLAGTVAGLQFGERAGFLVFFSVLLFAAGIGFLSGALEDAIYAHVASYVDKQGQE